MGNVTTGRNGVVFTHPRWCWMQTPTQNATNMQNFRIGPFFRWSCHQNQHFRHCKKRLKNFEWCERFSKFKRHDFFCASMRGLFRKHTGNSTALNIVALLSLNKRLHRYCSFRFAKPLSTCIAKSTHTSIQTSCKIPAHTCQSTIAHHLEKTLIDAPASDMGALICFHLCNFFLVTPAIMYSVPG